MAPRPTFCCLLLCLLALAPLTGCVSFMTNLLADDESTAAAVMIQQEEKMIAKEKRGEPAPKENGSWCVYWRLRFTSLRGVAAANSYYAKPSRQLIAYLQRRRAEEGVPRCDRPLVIGFTRDGRSVAAEPGAHRSIEGVPLAR